MKKILTFLLMVISAQMFAQNYPVTSINITLPANPDPNTANWGNGASVFIINATAKTGPAGIDKLLIECKILVTIKKGGDKVCGSYTSSNAPASNFNAVTKVWSGQNAVSFLGKACILTPGEYMVCVQFFGLRSNPLSEEKCKSFSIRGEEQQSYQPPQAISPADGSTISEEDAKKPVTFRWTTVVPRPNNEVIYKVKLIEIRQGQSATAAMKSASPIFEKEVVNQTQLVMPSLSPYPIAKDSKYGWYVQATNKEGKPVGGNNGNSGNAVFSVGGGGCQISYDAKITSFECISADSIKLCAKFICVKSGYGLSSGYVPYATIINSVSVLDQNNNAVIPSHSIGNPAITEGNTYSICKRVKINSTITKLIFHFDTKLNNPDHNCVNEATADTIVPICKCNFCDGIKWTFENYTATTQSTYNPNPNNTIYLTQAFTISSVPIISLKAEIINFRWFASSDCKRCNTDDIYWGNFTKGTLNNPGFQSNGIYPTLPNGNLLSNSHELHWVTENGQPVPFSGTLNLNISLPLQTELDCCKDCFRFCIRYSVTIKDNGICKTCSMIRCYETIRKHHPVLPTLDYNVCGESNTSSSLQK